jgi:hypothetical protein
MILAASTIIKKNFPGKKINKRDEKKIFRSGPLQRQF